MSGYWLSRPLQSTRSASVTSRAAWTRRNSWRSTSHCAPYLTSNDRCPQPLRGEQLLKLARGVPVREREPLARVQGRHLDRAYDRPAAFQAPAAAGSASHRRGRQWQHARISPRGRAMTQRAGDRVQRYLLDGSDEDLKRLIGLAEAHGEMARTALRRSGIAHGWNVIECGCGPVGALVQLAELVGDAGRVTGVDLNPAAVDRARSVAAALSLGNVRTLAADVHDLEAGNAGGP